MPQILSTDAYKAARKQTVKAMKGWRDALITIAKSKEGDDHKCKKQISLKG